MRIFSLDRIRQAKTLSESARATDPTELDRFLGASFGIFSGSARAPGPCCASAPRPLRWVADESRHPDQVGQWIDGRYELQTPCLPTAIARWC